jgi:low temperature requirement protein LtrA
MTAEQSPPAATAGPRWRVRMVSRAAAEDHRVSTPLELLYDLTFVVAVSQAAGALGNAVASDHVRVGLTGYLEVFFAIWWAWMNFTWFASGFDTDDVPYRLLTAVQMAGVLVLAAGVPAAFNQSDLTTITVGYVIMRFAMVAQWLRAAVSDPANRAIALRYAAGITVLQLLWIARLPIGHHWQLWTFLILALGELTVPVWAERGGGSRAPWHPHHIAERYGLFTIIVLGECVLAATVAIQGSLTSDGVSVKLVLAGVSALALLFGLWWLYFLTPTGHALSNKPEVAYYWGYGHYGIFASLAALGAGLEVAAAGLHEHLEVNDTGIGYAVAIPVACYLVLLSTLHSTVLSGFQLPRTAVLLVVPVLLLIPLASGVLSVSGVIAVIAVIVAALVAIAQVADERA